MYGKKQTNCCKNLDKRTNKHPKKRHDHMFAVVNYVNNNFCTSISRATKGGQDLAKRQSHDHLPVRFLPVHQIADGRNQELLAKLEDALQSLFRKVSVDPQFHNFVFAPSPSCVPSPRQRKFEIRLALLKQAIP